MKHTIEINLWGKKKLTSPCVCDMSLCLGTLNHGNFFFFADTEQIRETLRRGLEINSKPVLPPINAQRQNGLNHDRAP